MNNLIINAIFLVMSFIIAMEIVKYFDESRLRHLQTSIARNLSKSTDIKYSQYSASNKGIEIKMDAIDKFHLMYIERTNLKQIVGFANVYLVWLAMITLFFVSFIVLVKIVFSAVTATILAAIVASVPLMLLDLRAKHVSEKSRREIYSFVSSLRTWSNVKSDIIYIFEKASQDSAGPLGIFSKQMVTQIRGGLPPEVALEIFRLKVNNQYFDTLILNISQAFINQGDLTKLLINLEKEAFRLERAYNNRKMKTLLDRGMVFVLFISTLSIAIYLLTTSDSVRDMFVLRPSGQLVLTFASLAFAVGVFFQFKITEFDH